MKKLLGFVLCFGLAFAIGIGQSGCKKKDKEDKKVTAGEKFKATVPQNTEVKQGETAEVTLTIERLKDFKGEVKVELTAPEGTTADATSFSFAKDTTEKVVKLTAKKDAAAGDVKGSVKFTGGDKTRTVDLAVKIVAAEKVVPKKKVEPEPEPKKKVEPEPKKKVEPEPKKKDDTSAIDRFDRNLAVAVLNRNVGEVVSLVAAIRV